MSNFLITNLLVFIPLVGSLSTGIFKNKLSEKIVTFIAIFSVFISTVLSIWILIQTFFFDYYLNANLFVWASINDYEFYFGFLVDKLSSLMFFVVTFVSLMVHIYTIGYMHGDKGFKRFFSYLNAFTFAMLILVGSNNLLLLFVGWEAVGLISYLLIGFWFNKQSAVFANLKAFLINRVGDFGFIIGIGLIFYLFENFDYFYIFNNLELLENKNITGPYGLSFSLTTAICICLFIGAMGKSAQFPLHSWLPDSMEGPTPISALIHAATMVTAGIYMVSRLSPIFELSSFALSFILIIGSITALFMGLLGLVQDDIKKIIAYSTCSQLGYMFFATGVGAYNVAMFHLFTHAFFKALLFLGSGSVIHAFKDEQNINNMGGVWKKLPYTYCLMIIGTLALTGFPFLSGFYSKDAIIEFAYLRGNTTGYYAAGIGIFTALLTSIYSWRLIFKTFHGDYNNKKIKIDETHESPFIMLIPLILLSIGAIFAGFSFKELFIGYEGVNNFWRDSIFFLKPLSTDHPPLWFLLLTPTLVILSIPLAYYLFVKNKNFPEQIVSINKPLYQFLLNKWYFDELYDVLFVKTSKKFGLFLWKFFDLKIIDGFGPDGISSMIKKFSVKANKFQSGYIYHYAFIMLLGFSALLTFLIVK